MLGRLAGNPLLVAVGEPEGALWTFTRRACCGPCADDFVVVEAEKADSELFEIMRRTVACIP